MEKIKKIISFLGSMAAAKFLLLAVSIVLFAGSIFYHLKNEIFIPLNSKGLFDWMMTYGFEYPLYTWWFFLFVVLIAILGINTFFCTLDRLVKIISKFGNISSVKTKLFLLSPHIMHLSFIVLMLGYFSLYALGINTYNNIIKYGLPAKLRGADVKIELRNANLVPHESTVNEFINKVYLNPEYELAFIENGKETIRTVGLNRPCFYKGYSIHLAKFRPTKAGSAMFKDVWINLTIRKNAGIPLFIAGVILFMAGVVLYILFVFKKSSSKENI